MVNSLERIEIIFKEFITESKFIDAQPFGNGHINDTYLISGDKLGERVKFILRKINTFVFPDPIKIIKNTVNVTSHIRKKLIENDVNDINNKVLTPFRTSDNKYFCLFNNEYWCLFNYINNAYSVESVTIPGQAYEAAKTYGKFQKYLFDFDISKCHITIKDFHNIPNRISTLEKSIELDSYQRVKNVKSEIEVFRKYYFLKNDFEVLEKNALPIRITHNDTKINNILLNKDSNKGMCVIDLDTVMPGIVLNDFGDMVRSFASSGAEDDKDSSIIEIRLKIFKEIAAGYLEELNNYLTKQEISNLVLGVKIIVYEQAIRFLSDYLNGDQYYKVDYPSHNLVRSRNQFALLESIFEQSDEMDRILSEFLV